MQEEAPCRGNCVQKVSAKGPGDEVPSAEQGSIVQSGRDREGMTSGRIFTWASVVVNKGSLEAEEKCGPKVSRWGKEG